MSAPSEAWNIRKVLTWTTQHFAAKAIDAPRLTAELLLAHVLVADRIRLYTDIERPLAGDELTAYRALIQRRLAGEPTQYLTGVREFYGRPFSVDARVLIPRPETELLVDACLAHLAKGVPSRTLDLCTGSGCIAVTIACEVPGASVLAVDVSAAACAVARENAEKHHAGSRVTVALGDLYAAVPPDARFDAVVSNPPYIASHQLPTLQREVRAEPSLALDGGPDGLTVVRRVVAGATGALKAGGLLAVEIAEDQGAAVESLFREAGLIEVRVERDMARQNRLVLGKVAG